MPHNEIIADIHEVTTGKCSVTGKSGQGVIVSIPSSEIDAKFVRWPELKRLLRASDDYALIRKLGNSEQNGSVA